MNRNLQDDYMKLSREFDKYFAGHLEEFSEQTPSYFTLVVAKEGDEELNEYARAMVRNFNRRSIVEARLIDDDWRITPITTRARNALAH